MRFWLSLIVLVLAVSARAQSLDTDSSLYAADVFVAERTGPYADIGEPDSLLLKEGGFDCLIEARGGGTCSSGSESTRFKLPIGVADHVERVWYAGHEGDLLVLYEFSDLESGAARLARINFDSQDTLWVAHLPGFNAGPPLILAEDAFVTVIGFVGSVDLDTGIYRWKYDGLYDGGRFNAFRQPEIDGSVVRFTDSSGKHSVMVERESGYRLK